MADWQSQNDTSAIKNSESAPSRELASSIENVLPPPSNRSSLIFTEIIPIHTNDKNNEKNATELFNFSGPFSVNDSNAKLDVRILKLPKNIDSLCNGGKRLIVIVISVPWELVQRNAIRQTWATEAANTTSVIFLIGKFINCSIGCVKRDFNTHSDTNWSPINTLGSTAVN